MGDVWGSRVKTFQLGVDSLDIETCQSLLNDSTKLVIGERSVEQVERGHLWVKELCGTDQTVYGVNTGFGSLCQSRIEAKDLRVLQENLLKSHAVGVGSCIRPSISRLMLLLKCHSLALGHSGISLKLLKTLLWWFQSGWAPRVPKQGSLGASGDLAPLAHLFLPLLGLGQIEKDGKVLPSGAIEAPDYQLGPKEGLALINGTQFIAAHSVDLVHKARRLMERSLDIAALSIEAAMGSHQPFREELHRLRPHPGAQRVASGLRKRLQDSELAQSHADCDRVQDPYSLRCIPQVVGASWDAVEHLKRVLEVELNAVTDNPVLLSGKEAISGGLFHGEPLALPLDYVGCALHECGALSERRTYLLLDGRYGLPPELVAQSGLNTGFMIAQYTAAALVSENKTLCFPASADSLPTSMGQEDHVSMGSVSARKSLKILRHVEGVIAVEALCAAQAFDFRRPQRSSQAVEQLHREIRCMVPFVEKDVLLGPFIETLMGWVRS